MRFRQNLTNATPIVNNFLASALGNITLVKLTPSQIQEAYNRWAVGGRPDGKSGGLAPLTRRYIHAVLRSALTRAVEQQVLARMTHEFTVLVRRVKELPRNAFS
jgi:hypothetical protein